MAAITAKEIADGFVMLETGKVALSGATEKVWNRLGEYLKPTINGRSGVEVAEEVCAFLESTVGDAIVAAQNGKKSKPGAYRSAKSVISKAITKGVSLYNADGTTRGKTEVEKECREPQTEEAKADAAILALSRLIEGGYTLTADQKATIATMIH